MLPVATDASPAPKPACAAADPAITYVGSQLIKKRGGVDHYVITTTVTNIGLEGQTPDITQRIELVRKGEVQAPQSLPALETGNAYKVAFAVDRPSSERSQPLTVTIRYVLTSGNAARNACDRGNDETTTTF